MSLGGKEILRAFKSLHRTSQFVFANDMRMINEARLKINDEFKKFMNETDAKVIEERINLSKQIETELKQTVVQAEEVKPGVYRAKINKDTHKLDNIMYNEEAVLCASANRKKKCPK